MAVSLSEAPDTLYLELHAARRGEVFVLPVFTEKCETVIGFGSARITEDRQPSWDVHAPSIVLFSVGGITYEALSDDMVVLLLFNKNTARTLDDVRAFANRPTPIR
jgi:hypothetical protein